MLTVERLRELLDYDPLTGLFTWLDDLPMPKGGVRRQAGRIAGSLHKNGYLVICADSRHYRAARLAWLYMTGEWPKLMVDHKDTDPINNRWGNLRDVTRVVNAQNIKRARSTNQLGLLGVSKHGPSFRASIDSKHIAVFKTPGEAHEAYLQAKRQLHAGCTI